MYLEYRNLFIFFRALYAFHGPFIPNESHYQISEDYGDLASIVDLQYYNFRNHEKRYKLQRKIL